MRYQFISVFQLNPGFNLPRKDDNLEILKTKTTEAFLTKTPDLHCVEIRREIAFRRLSAKRLFNNVDSHLPLDRALTLEIDQVNDEHKKRYGDDTEFLVIKQHGESQFVPKEIFPVLKNFAVSYDSFDKDKIKCHHDQEIAQIKAGLGIASDGSLHINPVADVLVFYNETEQAIHNLQYSFSTESYYLPGLTQEKIENIKRCVKSTCDNNDKSIVRVLTLFSDMLNQKHSDVESFVFGWAALEIFVKYVWKDYEKGFYASLKSDRPNASLSKFVKRVSAEFSRKDNVRDCFDFIAAALNDNDSSLIEDQHEFSKIKNDRDGYFHSGKDIALPRKRVAQLLSKYLQLHLITPKRK